MQVETVVSEHYLHLGDDKKKYNSCMMYVYKTRRYKIGHEVPCDAERFPTKYGN